MRILGLRTMDPSMTEAYFNGEDIHKSTASLAFGVPVEEVTKDQRQAAKAVAFGLIYGKSTAAQAMELGIPVHEAQDIVDKYFSTKPNVAGFIENTHQFLEQNGYVETMQGHRRQLKGIWTKDKRSDALRQSVNTVVQGSGAFLTNSATILIDKYIQENNMRSKLVATVHDSIVVDSPAEEVVEMANVMKIVMENLPIEFLRMTWNGQLVQYPIAADVEVGMNYKDAVGFDQEELGTFKSVKGYCKYHNDLSKLEDYFDSKALTEEQYEEAVAQIEAGRQAYQLI